jgi:L-threonylcarbamoyladenylate synthase
MNALPKSLILDACAFSRKGGLVAIPTETVYGLAAPLTNLDQLNRIFELKERPFFDPLIVHVAEISEAKKLVSHWTELAQCLASTFWPGPLTLVLPKNPQAVPDIVTSGLTTVGVRVPNHPVALEFIRKLGTPVAAPSANKFTKTSPTKASHVSEIFSSEDVFVLDGGDCEVGIESTIVAVAEHELTILRLGMITKSALEESLHRHGLKVSVQEGRTALDQMQGMSPGNFSIHYRPTWPVAVCVSEPSPKQLVQIATCFKLDNSNALRLRTLDDRPAVAARELYSFLRAPLGEQACALVLTIPKLTELSPDDQEAWQALRDRLKKAASLWIDGEL